MKILFSICTLLLAQSLSFSQSPVIEWEKCYGGTSYDHPHSIMETIEGNYIIAGTSYSSDNHVWGNNGTYDYWILEINSFGDTIWSRCYGGSDYDYGGFVDQTSDEGFIIVGESSSNDGFVSGNNGGYDYWLIKTNSWGDTIWTRSYGGSETEYAYTIPETTDGGFIITGYTRSSDGDVSGNHGEMDVWIVKVDNFGDTLWTKCLGGTADEGGFSIFQTYNSGYILVGTTESNDGDVYGNHGNRDYWIIKLDSIGEITWSNCLGGSSDDVGLSITPTIDQGYITTGYSDSNDGDVSGNHGGRDYWVAKLDSLGEIVWSRCYGGSEDDEARSIQQTQDSGFIVAGYALSNDGDVSGNHGNKDFWIIKLDINGEISWSKCLGGSDIDAASMIQQTQDYGYIVAGFTYSNDGDISSHIGNCDYWVIKLQSDSISEIKNTHPPNYKLYPNPAINKITVHATNIQSIEIINTYGRVINQFNSNCNIYEIGLENLSTGLYLIRIETDKEIITDKFVKNYVW